ncbi:MAG: hypothetical protein LH480_06590 [Rubrivivax sp.]|nr:hypothetical protein [Rubrivivax sp.]
MSSTPGSNDSPTLRFDRRLSGHFSRLNSENRAVMAWAAIVAFAMLSFFVHLLHEHMQRSVVLQAEMASSPASRKLSAQMISPVVNSQGSGNELALQLSSR